MPDAVNESSTVADDGLSISSSSLQSLTDERLDTFVSLVLDHDYYINQRISLPIQIEGMSDHDNPKKTQGEVWDLMGILTEDNHRMTEEIHRLRQQTQTLVKKCLVNLKTQDLKTQDLKTQDLKTQDLKTQQHVMPPSLADLDDSSIKHSNSAESNDTSHVVNLAKQLVRQDFRQDNSLKLITEFLEAVAQAKKGKDFSEQSMDTAVAQKEIDAGYRKAGVFQVVTFIENYFPVESVHQFFVALKTLRAIPENPHSTSRR